MKKGLKNISVAISIVATTALLSGCGGSSSSKNLTTTSQNTLNPTKVDRAWNDDGINSNANISASVISRDDGTELLFIKSNINSYNIQNFQFFINTDNNKNTGNEALDGADYLIENSHVYKSTGRNWSWSYVGEVDFLSADHMGDGVRLNVNTALLGQLANKISIINFRRDENWKAVEVTQRDIELKNDNQEKHLSGIEAINIINKVDPDMMYYTVDKDSITVVDDNTISYNSHLSAGPAGFYSEHYRNLYNISKDSKKTIEHIQEYAHAHISNNQIKMNLYGLDHWQIFINSDADTQTGNERYNGADFLIEDGHLYRSMGRGWSWEYIKDLDHNDMAITYQQGDLGELKSNNFMNLVQFTVVTKDKNWNTEEEFYTGKQ